MNGKVNLTENGQFAVYTCDDGNLIKGIQYRECTRWGHWAGTAPTCTGEYCQNYSIIVDVKGYVHIFFNKEWSTINTFFKLNCVSVYYKVCVHVIMIFIAKQNFDQVLHTSLCKDLEY